MPLLAQQPSTGERLCGREVVQAHVRPAAVIVFDASRNDTIHIVYALKARIGKQFMLYCGVDAFCLRIVFGVAILGHANADIVVLKYIHIIGTGVLHTSVTMVYQPFDVKLKPRAGFQGHNQGGRSVHSLQRAPNIIPHDVTGIRVQDYAHIAEPDAAVRAVKADICYVGNPYLACPVGYCLMNQVRKCRVAMQRAGGAYAVAFLPELKSMRCHHALKNRTADMSVLPDEDQPQLAAANPRVKAAFTQRELHYLSLLLNRYGKRLFMRFVVRLLTYAK